jgi:hypothetical protein
MPSAEQIPAEHRHYSDEELLELRRSTLRFARSLRPGSERNQHRQIAASLRALFRNEQWLADHGARSGAVKHP